MPNAGMLQVENYFPDSDLNFMEVVVLSFYDVLMGRQGIAYLLIVFVSVVSPLQLQKYIFTFTT